MRPFYFQNIKSFHLIFRLKNLEKMLTRFLFFPRMLKKSNIFSDNVLARFKRRKNLKGNKKIWIAKIWGRNIFGDQIFQGFFRNFWCIAESFAN